MDNSRKYITFLIEQIFFGILIWIYVSFLMKMFIYYLHNIILGIILIALMGLPVKYFILDNSFKKNKDIFNKNVSIIQEIMIFGIFIILVLTIGNAYEYLMNISL